MITPEAIQEERAYLLRYARLHLQDAVTAEEVVQEALLGALESRESFTGKSSVRTWLTGILKFKIIDEIRRSQRSPALGSRRTHDDEDDLQLEDSSFDASGHWTSPVRPWGKPEETLLDKQLWAVYETCCTLMPQRTALVFTLREVAGLEISEICQQLDITATNCSALLYRARLRLQECLEARWFGEKRT